MDHSTPQAPALRRCAVFLDIDGTLLDLAATPSSVIVPPYLPPLLRRLGAEVQGALAFISGRSLTDIDQLFGPGIAAAAEHGAILREADGHIIESMAAGGALDALLAPLREAVAAHPGTLLERKRFGFALHWRKAPHARDALTAAAAALAAQNPALVLQPAHDAVEIRLRGPGKAGALERFMRMPRFAGRLPVFIGDDVTDEPAIARATLLGGRGLHVRRDFAGSAQSVRDWLAAWVDSAESQHD